MAISRRSAPRRQAPQRQFVWGRQNSAVVVAAVDGFNDNLLSNFETAFGADLLGATVMRVRGTVFWNTGNAALTGITCATGIRLYTQGGSIADEEGPLTQEHGDWMAYSTTILSGPSVEYQQARLEVDVKSNRKLSELGQGLLLSFQHDASATAIDVSYVLSVGLKLS